MSGFPLILLNHYFVGINYCIDVVTFIESENTNLCIYWVCFKGVLCYVFEHFSIDVNKSVVHRDRFRIFSRCNQIQFAVQICMMVYWNYSKYFPGEFTDSIK